jgi:hypothetical protein
MGWPAGFIGRKMELCVVQWKFPLPLGKVFLGFVAAARNKKMHWKGLSVNYYIPFSRVLSDGSFQLHSSPTKAKATSAWKGRNGGQGTVTVVLIACGEKGKVLPGSSDLHPFVMCACGAEEFRKRCYC